MLFSTASLMEQETPYLLPLELARGTVSQLADQLFEWKSIGLVVPDALSELVYGVYPADGRGRDGAGRSGRFGSVGRKGAPHGRPRPPISWRPIMSNRHWPFGGAARASLRVIWGPIWARASSIITPPGIFSRLSTPPTCRSAGATWKRSKAITIGASRTSKSNGAARTVCCVSAGPLLPFDAHALPDWLTLWEGDMDNLLVFFADYITHRGRALSRQGRYVAMRRPGEYGPTLVALGRR